MGSARLHYIPRKGEQNVKLCYFLRAGCDILKKSRNFAMYYNNVIHNYITPIIYEYKNFNRY